MSAAEAAMSAGFWKKEEAAEEDESEEDAREDTDGSEKASDDAEREEASDEANEYELAAAVASSGATTASSDKGWAGAGGSEPEASKAEISAAL